MTRAGMPWAARALAGLLLAMLAVPLVALIAGTSAEGVARGLAHPLFAPALWLSVRTSLMSLALVVLAGAPLAWWLAHTRSRAARVVEVIVQLPIVLPPAVVGVGLLEAFGRRGLFGPALEAIGVSVPFTASAVVLAQVVVAAPFFVQAAANAFRSVSPDMLLAARSMGATPTQALRRVALPVALPGLAVGAALAAARALGEFGATLLFAGNLTGSTQTLPLAIYTALETDVELAVVFSLTLTAIGVCLLAALRGAPALGRSG